MQGFISYSHCDADQVDELRRQLHRVVRKLGIELWIDEQIRVGDKWDSKIKEALGTAELFLFCVSPDLLFSQYVEEVEVKAARAKRDCGKALMVPVILRDCLWEWVDVFAELQAVPKGGWAIQLWNPRDSGYADAARRIGAMLRAHRAAQGSSP